MRLDQTRSVMRSENKNAVALHPCNSDERKAYIFLRSLWRRGDEYVRTWWKWCLDPSKCRDLDTTTHALSGQTIDMFTEKGHGVNRLPSQLKKSYKIRGKNCLSLHSLSLRSQPWKQPEEEKCQGSFSFSDWDQENLLPPLTAAKLPHISHYNSRTSDSFGAWYQSANDAPCQFAAHGS